MARRGPAGGVREAPPADRSGEREVEADPDEVARTICLRLLTFRARTRTELSDALAAREVPLDAAERVLGRLTAVGLIDDRAFAASFVSSRTNDRGLASREIARQLRAKGVDDEVVADALVDRDADAETATARGLVERKLRSMSRLEPPVQTRRLVGMLARKGYSPGMAYQVVKDVLGEHAANDADDDTAWLA